MKQIQSTWTWRLMPCGTFGGDSDGIVSVHLDRRGSSCLY